MKLLQVVEDSSYMVWQLYVQMLNFRDLNIEQDATILVSCETPSAEMKEFQEWTKAEVLYYPDTRVSRSYTSSRRPHLLAKYFRDHPEITVYMYHDQDIIFRYKPDIDKLAEGDMNYVAMGAHNYTGTDYMLLFKKYQFYSFCEICEIKPEDFIKERENCGGAQYILKNTPPEFWEYCELKCEQAHRYFTDITVRGLREWFPQEKLPETPEPHIQIWATDMYVLLAGMVKHKMAFKWAPEIDFCWPFWSIKASIGKPILHNAGIDHTNEMKTLFRVEWPDNTRIVEGVLKDRATQVHQENPGSLLVEESCTRQFFNKTHYHGRGHYPFGEDLSYVSTDHVQREYIHYINRFDQHKKHATMSKRKILAVFCTHNKINPDLLALVLKTLKVAQESTTLADVQVITNSWETIPNNPFEGQITPFREMGHLNYVLQIKQAITDVQADIVSIHEHDVLYPPNYFDEIIKHFDFDRKYGVWNNNYIGMNETGYLAVKQRDQPFSLMACAKFYLESQLHEKIDECFLKIKKDGGFGWCYVEPHKKEDFSIIPHSDVWPAIHVNMNHLGNWHTGKQGKNHHFTNHCEVVYNENSNGVVDRPGDWGNFRKYFTFDQIPATNGAAPELKAV